MKFASSPFSSLSVTALTTILATLFSTTFSLTSSIYSNDISDKLWHPLGTTLPLSSELDTNSMEQAGYSVATNDSGLRVAIGSPHYSSRRGRVRVYEFNQLKESWEKVGDDIVGSSIGELFGQVVKMDHSGSFLAVGSPNYDKGNKQEVGCVKVFQVVDVMNPGIPIEFQDELPKKWFMTGNTIVGDDSFGHFGTDFNLFSDKSGDVESDSESLEIVIGAPGALHPTTGKEVGSVSIYRIDIEEDQQITNVQWVRTFVKYGDELFAKYGTSVSMTKTGDMLAVGSPKFRDSKGKITVYKKTGADFVPMSIDAYEEFANEAGFECGSVVQLDFAGEYFVYSCPKAHSNTKLQAGKIELFKLSGSSSTGTNEWERLRTPIFGENDGDHAGTSIALRRPRDEILFLAVGAPDNTPSSKKRQSGHARIYHANLDNEEWKIAGYDIDGKASFEKFGHSVALALDGHRVIVGAPDGDGNGYALAFELTYSAPPTSAPTRAPSIAKKPTRGSGGTDELKDIEKKRKTSGWLVLFITIFSFCLLFVIFKVGMKMRSGGFSRSGQNIEHMDLRLNESHEPQQPYADAPVQLKTPDII